MTCNGYREESWFSQIRITDDGQVIEVQEIDAYGGYRVSGRTIIVSLEDVNSSLADEDTLTRLAQSYLVK